MKLPKKLRKKCGVGKTGENKVDGNEDKQRNVRFS